MVSQIALSVLLNTLQLHLHINQYNVKTIMFYISIPRKSHLMLSDAPFKSSIFRRTMKWSLHQSQPSR